MPNMAEVIQLTAADEKTTEEIATLLQQLNEKTTSLGVLRSCIENINTELWTVKDEEKIVGMATLVLLSRTRGTSSRIEDVVVDESYRGKGLGVLLIQKIIERAKARGAYSLHLTSRPDRAAANKLYQKLGFELRETNVYQMKL